MKIYSEKTGKEYQTIHDCVLAEAQFDKEVAEKNAKEKKMAEDRKKRANEVEETYKTVVEAQRIFSEKLSKFIEDYGSFHFTFRAEDYPFHLSDIFDGLYKRFF